MKIYNGTRAPNPRRVRIFLAEKGIDMTYQEVDVLKGENRTEEYRRTINPMGRIPVLEFDDGSHLAESVAICRYFEEIQPDPPLFGVDARDKANVEMWNRRIEHHVMAPVGQTFRHTFPGFADRVEQLPAWAEQNRRAAEEMFGWLDEVLGQSDYIAGERFSIADITALCTVDFAKASQIRIQPEQANLARWHGLVSARPSAAA